MNVRHAQRPDQTQNLKFGSYPTPLWRLAGSDEQAHDLWIKDDGRTASAYGGNKVRKLERLLAAAQHSGAKRLLTLGAAGSHHVLATCLYGARVGLATHAVLTPQPWSEHAEATLRAGLNSGLTATPAHSYLAALAALGRQRRPGDFVIAPGGSGSEGTWAYCLAVDELREQLAQHQLPALDAIIVAAGSGSTAAGLLAGILRTGTAQRIIAVQVAPNPALRALVVGQAAYALWRHDRLRGPVAALRALRVERRFIGAGYGHSTPLGAQASALARSFGLELEPTYTAKAFAAALELARATRHDNVPCKLRLHRRRTYLYWHTLSAVPLAALLVGAPEKLPGELAHLLLEPNLYPSRSATPLSRR
jgi:1-aminocyclopropane-1-carboxylate deaminase/D-cysteine desulfhydrase-like pyridoxal-dependent ACC family enzyme